MVLTRYRDVASALRDPRMHVVGGDIDEAAHSQMRDHARRLYAKDWRGEFSAAARDILAALSGELELVGALAEPWSLSVAACVSGIAVETARRLLPAAWIIFRAGASPDDEPLREQSRQAAAAMASNFPPPVAALHTQAFVALAVSLPAFLGNAWLALFENPEEFQWLGQRTAIDELLRFAGPSLTQRRTCNGQPVELRLAEANRDPEQFEHPYRLDLRRRNAATHLAFGGGAHACAGALLIRNAALVIFPAFAERFRHARLIRSEPYGGDAIRGHRVYVI